MAAARLASRWRFAAPMAVAAVGGATMVYPRRTAYAEAPDVPSRKPIYDAYPSAAAPPLKPSTPSTSKRSEEPHSPTPTDRLTVQVGKARLFLYDNAKQAEQSFNDFWSWILRHETSASNTIASLAPPKESGEQLLPGGIYVLVATMAGSIVTRNRNILIRATLPLAVGITAGWYLIPITMQNVSDLTWEYEKKVPAVAETHAMVSGFTKHVWETGKAHSAMTYYRAEDKLSDVRGTVEDWVKKGK